MRTGHVYTIMATALAAAIGAALGSVAHAGTSADYNLTVNVLDGCGLGMAASGYTVLTASSQAGEVGASASSDYEMQYGLMPQYFEALPPTTPVVNVTPRAPYTTNNLVCSVTREAMVAPGLQTLYEYSWSNGVDTVVHGNTTSLSDTLSKTFTRKNQTWTCSVRAYDGTSYSPIPGSASVTLINMPPTAPVIDLPVVRSTGSNLICEVVLASFDPDTDPETDTDLIAYRFDWFVNRQGESTYSPFSGAIDSQNLSLVSNADTVTGDHWYCIVTPFDDETAGAPSASAPCEIRKVGTAPSHVSLSLDRTVITLGQSITAYGGIFPAPESAPINVFFESTSPSGVVDNLFPESVVIPDANYLRTFLPKEASAGRSPWSLRASWPGDVVYDTTVSEAVQFTVLKAQPELSLELSHAAAPLGFTSLRIEAALSTTLPPALQRLIEGLPVNLYLRKPDGSSAGPVTARTDAEGIAKFFPADFAAAGIGFAEAGTWQFLGEFTGNDNFKHALSPGYERPDSARLTLKDGAGYAIIAIGSLDQYGEGLPEHTKTGDYVYRAFRERGFAEDDIYYMAAGASDPFPDIRVDDTTPSEADVQWAIENWAQEKMNAAAAPLYLVLIDHGAIDKFYVYSGSYDATRVITPLELDAYIDTLEVGLDAAAFAQPRVLIYGACHSGSFIGQVSAPGRVIITSSAEDEISHRGVKQPGTNDVRDGEPLVTELFRNASAGKTLKESFALATARMQEYLGVRSDGQGAQIRPQTPLLDDNGDGIGSPSSNLYFEPGFDGAVAHELVLGYGVNASDSVGWIEATQTLTLAPSAPMVPLFARASEAPSLGHIAWCEVKTPLYAGAEPTASGIGAGGERLEDFQHEMNLLAFESETSDPADGRYEWADFGTTFNVPGTYKVYYFIKDAVSGETSAHLLTTIYRQDTANIPPEAVTPRHPGDGETVSTGTVFSWSPSFDPDGDELTYRIEFATDEHFTNVVLSHDGVAGTHTQVIGLADGQTYYWRVIPVDAYGAEPDARPAYVVTMDNYGNPSQPGWIAGTVSDAVSHAAIRDATVTWAATGRQTLTDAEGNFLLLNVTPGTHSVTVSKAGYKSRAKTNIAVFSGAQTEVAIALTPNDGPFRWGDLNADTKVGTSDASLISQWNVGLVDRFPIDESIVRESFPTGGDVNGDGILGTLDASDILRLRVGLIDGFHADTDGDGFGPESGKRLRANLVGAGPLRQAWLETVFVQDDAPHIEAWVMLDDARGVRGFTAVLTYDEAAVAVREVKSTDLTSAWPVPSAATGADAVHVAGFGAHELDGAGALAVIVFESSAGKTSGFSIDAVHLESVSLNDGQVSVFTN